MTLADKTAKALERVTSALPGGGEQRAGQLEMARAVADTIEQKGHLVAQAGTGTGKSLAYLIPAVLSGKKVVVSTATKALQDQLAEKDLPFLTEALDRAFEYAVLKGRSNYLCRQRVSEIEVDNQLSLDGVASSATVEEEIEAILEWAETTYDGDRAGLAFEPSPAAWAAVSVGPRECPGKNRCPKGEACFAEQARSAAAAADVVVVNTHLYGIHLATEAVLPQHDLVILDEAHQVEDIVSSTLGFELGVNRFRSLSRNVGSILADDDLVGNLDEAGEDLAEVLERHVDERLPTQLPDPLVTVLNRCRDRAERINNGLKGVPDDASEDVKTRKLRATQAATALIDDIDKVLDPPEADVLWVEGRNPVLKVAPLEIHDLMKARLWDERAAILTSATIPTSLPERLGLGPEEHELLDVGSPFDYESNALLYCAAHLPDPRDDEFMDAMINELEMLIIAAGGRTLALFTSRRAMMAAADELAPRLPFEVLTQDQLPKPKLIEKFSADEALCLFATMSFWQGIDVRGPALSLVTIDKLPFPRPDNPLLQARRDLAGRSAFGTIDLPRAATLLAQGVGRLIRSATDTGVVAVFDPRLAKSKSYRWEFINALPPMPRTKDRADAEAFLTAIRDR